MCMCGYICMETHVYVCGFGKVWHSMEMELCMGYIIIDLVCHNMKHKPENNGKLLEKFKQGANKM